MELSNEFDVPLPVEEAWTLLTDLERIAPCLPGAALTGVEGDDHRGTVKVKVGPITAQYKGTARIVERDDEAHVAVLEATGRDTRGQGTASAAIRAELRPAGDAATHVSLVTDLSVSGKVAQFGRGALGDVSAKLLGQFVDNLERDLLASGPAPGPGGAADEPAADEPAADEPAADEPARADVGEAADTGVRRPAPTEADVEPIDLLATAGEPLGRRLLPVVGLVGAVLVLLGLLRRRRRRLR